MRLFCILCEPWNLLSGPSAHGVNSCLSPAAPDAAWKLVCVRRLASSPGLSFSDPRVAGPRTFSESVYCVLS